MVSTNKQKWLAEFHRNVQDYPALISTDPFENWDRSTQPDGHAEIGLWLGTQSFYAGDPGEFGERFLRRSKLVCDRIISDEKWKTPQRVRIRIRATTFRIRSYLNVFESGYFDLDALRRASLDYEEWCLVCLKGTWTWDAVQQDYLTSILLALFADDFQRAQHLIEKKKKYHFHIEFLDILKSIAYSGAATPWPKSSDAYEKFTAYFDKIRDPDYQPKEATEVPLRRLELGFIQEKYYESKTGRLDWQRVMDLISE